MHPLYPALGLGALLLATSTKKASAAATPPPPSPPTPPTPPTPGGGPPSAAGVVDQEIYLEAARDGRLQLVWIDLKSAPGWQVTADAVKLDGVRFPVTARTAQLIADILEARLTTPLLEDLIETDASARITSPTWDYRTMQTPEAIAGFNQEIDRQLFSLEAARNELVSCVGKSWVLTRELETKPVGTSCNYGMFRPDGPYLSVTRHYQLWQQPGYRHNIEHWDYSQVLRLCRPKSKGLTIPSHDGVTITRQPGV